MIYDVHTSCMIFKLICRRHADVWSHPSHYPQHPPTPHQSTSWSWMDDSHPIRSMSIGNPIPEIKAISDLEISTPRSRSRSWVWSKGKVIQSAQYHINSPRFNFTSIRPTIPEIKIFRNLTLKYPRSRSWMRSKVKVTYCTQYSTDALPFRFTSIGPTIPKIWPK